MEWPAEVVVEERQPLQLADRPWREISTVRLPDAVAPAEPPPPEDDAPTCNLLAMLKQDSAAYRYVDGVGVHRAISGDRSGADARAAYGAYGAAGAASRCAARLRLLDVRRSGEFSDCDVAVGATKLRAHKCVLAHRSAWFAAALTHCGAAPVVLPVARKALSANVAVRLVDYVYTGDGRELAALLDACDDEADGADAADAAGESEPFPPAVELLLVADQLLLGGLRGTLVQALQASLSTANAASLLSVTADLTDDAACDSLRRACLGHVVAAGVDAARLASGDAVFDAAFSPMQAQTLRWLHAVSKSNPLCCGAELVDPGEAVALIRDSLREQEERLSESEKRLAEAAPGMAAYALERSEKLLENQRRHLVYIGDFLNAQEGALQNAGAAPAAARPAAGPVAMSYDWQRVSDETPLPAGLDIRVDISGKAFRQVRIPPTWKLRLYVPEWRTLSLAVSQTTTVGDVLAQVRDAQVRDKRRAGRHSLFDATLRALDPERTFDAALWADRAGLRLV